MTTVVTFEAPDPRLEARPPRQVESPFREGERCDAIAFPSEAQVRSYLWRAIDPLRGRTPRFIESDPIEMRRRGDPEEVPAVSGIYPVGRWGTPLTEGQKTRAVRAVDLVCSSYSFTFWVEQWKRKDSFRQFGALFPITKLSIFDPELDLRPMQVAWFRWLSKAQQSRMGGPVPIRDAVPGSTNTQPNTLELVVYGETWGPAERPSRQFPNIYAVLRVDPYNPSLGRWSSDHPVVATLTSGGLTSTFFSFAEPGRNLERSFVFPLRWGPATRLDISDGQFQRLLSVLEDFGVSLELNRPLFGLPPSGRRAIWRLADNVRRQAYKLTGGWRDPSEDVEEAEGLSGFPRTWGGRTVRNLGFVAGYTILGLPAGLAGGFALESAVAQSKDALFRIGMGLEQAATARFVESRRPNRAYWAARRAAVDNPPDELTDRGYAINESLAVAVGHVGAAMAEFSALGGPVVRRDPISGLDVIPYTRRLKLGRGALAARGLEDLSEAEVMASLLMPNPGFYRNGDPDVTIPGPRPNGVEDPAQPRRCVWDPVLHLRSSVFAGDLDAIARIPRVHSEWYAAARHALRFANDLEVAMEIYQLTLQCESGWLALFPIMQSPDRSDLISFGQQEPEIPLRSDLGATGNEAGAIDPHLRVLLDRLEEISPARLIAFVWRQNIVDDFVEAMFQGAPARVDSGEGPTRPWRATEFSRECLWDLFCWMRTPRQRGTLDLVLGPVGPTEHPGLRVRRDARGSIFERLFTVDPREISLTDPPLFADFARRWRSLTCEEQEVWTDFLELVRKRCAPEWAELLSLGDRVGEPEPPRGPLPEPDVWFPGAPRWQNADDGWPA